MTDQELIQSVLQEIDALLKSGVLPVTVDHLMHLRQEGDMLHHLIEMKKDGLISGDLVTMSGSGEPHRMTNIRLTYLGIRSLRQ